MLDIVLPSEANNNYRGHPASLYFFILITTVTVLRSLAHILLPDGGAESIATIDIDVGGREVIILIFAYWGLSQLLLGLFFILVIIRYRNLIPLMYILIFLEYTLRLIIGQFKSIETQGTAPGAIGNLILPVIAVIFFLLSIKSQDT